jgi:hypothetical protein
VAIGVVERLGTRECVLVGHVPRFGSARNQPKVSDLRNQGGTDRLIFFSPAAEATERQLGKSGYPISEVKERRDSSIYLARRRTRGTVFTQPRCARKHSRPYGLGQCTVKSNHLTGAVFVII